MSDKGYGTGSVLLAVFLGIVIGGVGGFYFRFWNEPERPTTMASGGEAATPMGSAGGSSRPAAGPAMGGMAAGAASSGADLARLVRNLATIQKVQNQGLTREQARSLLPVLKALKDAETLPEAQASARLKEIDGILTQGQRDALAAMVPFRGGGARSGGATPPAPAGSGPPSRPVAGGLMQPGGGGGGMMGGMMGGDPERPFASERNAAALDDLIGAAEVLAR